MFEQNGQNGSNGNHNSAASSNPGKLHLLEIVGNAIVGGMEQHVRTLVEHLPSTQFQVTCICPFESPFTQQLRRAGCAVVIAPMRDDPPWRSIQSGVTWARQLQIDVIHAHLPSAHALAGVIGGLTGTPVVATIHGMNLTPLDLEVAQTTGTNLILVCQAAYSQAMGMGIPASRLALIRNGVDVEQFTPYRSGEAFRRRLGLDAETPLVGFVGRLAVEKAPDKFVAAAERIHRQRPRAHFVVVGTGAMEEQLRAAIAGAKLGKVVHMTGVQSCLQDIYPALDVVVQPSRMEGTPLAMLEAMAAARPVVTTNVGGVPELIEQGVTGILLEAGEGPGLMSAFGGDPEGIAAAVNYLLDHPGLRKQMGAAARHRAQMYFDIRSVVRQTTELFWRLAALRRQARSSPTRAKGQLAMAA